MKRNKSFEAIIARDVDAIEGSDVLELLDVVTTLSFFCYHGLPPQQLEDFCKEWSWRGHIYTLRRLRDSVALQALGTLAVKSHLDVLSALTPSHVTSLFPPIAAAYVIGVLWEQESEATPEQLSAYLNDSEISVAMRHALFNDSDIHAYFPASLRRAAAAYANLPSSTVYAEAQ